MRGYDYEYIEAEAERKVAEKMLGSGEVTIDVYNQIIADQELSKLKRQEYEAQRAVIEAEGSTARAMADRATKKVQWAEYWMVYSIVLIIVLASAFFVVMHGLAVN